MRAILFAGLAALCTGLSATETRSAGMALDADLSWVLPNQFLYLFRNPAMVMRMEDSFYAEYSKSGAADASERASAFFGVGKSGVIGVALGYPAAAEVLNSNTDPRGFFTTNGGVLFAPPLYGQLDLAIASSDGLTLAKTDRVYLNSRNPLQYRNFTLFYAFETGKIQSGISVSYAYSSETFTRTDRFEENLRLFKGELTTTIGSSFALDKILPAADLSLSHRYYILQNSYNERDGSGSQIEASLQSRDPGDLEANGFLAARLSRHHMLRFSVTAAYLSSGTRARARSTVPGFALNAVQHNDRSGSLTRFGIADEVLLAGRTTAFLGLQIANFRYDTQYDGRDKQAGAAHPVLINEKYESLRTVLVFGFESALSDSWMFRFGMNQTLNNASAPDITTTTSDRNASGTITGFTSATSAGVPGASSRLALGFSFRKQRFRIDYVANAAFFRAGPNILSGATNDIGQALAFVYYFSADPDELPPAEGSR